MRTYVQKNDLGEVDTKTLTRNDYDRTADVAQHSLLCKEIIDKFDDETMKHPARPVSKNPMIYW